MSEENDEDESVVELATPVDMAKLRDEAALRWNIKSDMGYRKIPSVDSIALELLAKRYDELAMKCNEIAAEHDRLGLVFEIEQSKRELTERAKLRQKELADGLVLESFFGWIGVFVLSIASAMGEMNGVELLVVPLALTFAIRRTVQCVKRDGEHVSEMFFTWLILAFVFVGLIVKGCCQ